MPGWMVDDQGRLLVRVSWDAAVARQRLSPHTWQWSVRSVGGLQSSVVVGDWSEVLMEGSVGAGARIAVPRTLRGKQIEF